MDYAVILAGGTGKRLWPLSRQRRPKQILKLLDGQTLLRKCFERLKAVFDFRNILVLANADYADLIRENLNELPEENVIAEPAVRDTAAAIGLASAVLQKYDSSAVMAVVTADQILEPAEAFESAMRAALAFVRENPQGLITFGIKPTFPSTQLGYIYFGDEVCRQGGKAVYRINAFKEKPDLHTAQEYLESGQYRWNSGLFVWRCGTILQQLAQHLPACIEPLRHIQADWGTAKQQQTLAEWFPKMPKISIDYAVMEKSDQVYGISLDCRWLDMGSFTALADVLESDENDNIIVAEHSELMDCRNMIIITEDKDHLIAAIGLENMVIAHSKDATLVCPISQNERIKELLENVRKHKDGKYL